MNWTIETNPIYICSYILADCWQMCPFSLKSHLLCDWFIHFLIFLI